MSARARVAVLVPCYRDAELAVEAVHSVKENEPVELVVIDDYSDLPSTAAVLRRLEAEGVTVLHNDSNRGPAAARATGLRATSAPYVFQLDSDDLAVPGALGEMADLLDRHPEADVCYGDYVEFGEAEVMRAVPAAIDGYRLAYTNEYPVSSLFRRSLLDEVGGWPPLRAYEDWHLWMTLAERGTVAVHVGPGMVTYRRRLHGRRLLTASKGLHPQLYARLREDHPGLFASIAAHRRRSDLQPLRKLLYPFVYGGRRRFGWETHVKNVLDRLGIWTLRR
jgi:glycosyltransferase involved in cell wall biosynthesis